MNKMPARRRGCSSDSSCCCAEHRYLCPVHRNAEAEPSSNLACWWQECKKPLIALAIVLIGVFSANYLMIQNNKLMSMQHHMKKELNQIVQTQKALLDSIQDGKSGEGAHMLKDLIKREINAYDADKIARVDFALESAGGRILSILSTKPYITDQTIFTKIWHVLLTTLYKDGDAETARPILQPRTAPGECWAFEGSNGAVMIKLLAKILIRGVTIEHIPVAISPSAGITSAPKVFNLWGLKYRDDTNAFLFGEFTYQNDSTPMQYFDVPYQSKIPYDIVLLKILSNWGNPRYTCVYRVRIHGELLQD